MGITVRNHAAPDAVREFSNGSDALVSVTGKDVGRAEFRPGWRWSNDVRPLVGTASCEVAHFGYLLSGTLHVEAEDGTSVDLTPGDVFDIPAGHDAWVVGNEPVVMLDWGEKTATYAVPVVPADAATR